MKARSFICVCTATIVLACGGASSKPASVQNASAVPDPHEMRRVDLEFGIGTKPFPLPIVRGTVAGVSALFLVDTGANAHILSGWLARKAQLTTQRFGDTGTDHAGNAIDTRRALHPQIQISGWGALPDEPALVTDMPDAVTRLGIGGFISPQQLASEQVSIVMDFQHNEMREMKHGETLEAPGNAFALDPPRTCLDAESPLQGLVFVVSAQIDGNDAQLLVDTGAHHSDLLAGSKAAKALAARSEPSHESVYAASGKVTPRTVKAAKLRVGALEVTRDVDLIPGQEDPFCPRDGVLAMDILKQCAIVLDRHTVSGLCTSDGTPK